MNPNHVDVERLLCFPDVETFPEDTDLVILAVNKGLLLGVVERCGQRGLRPLIAVTAGFKEGKAKGELGLSQG